MDSSAREVWLPKVKPKTVGRSTPGARGRGAARSAKASPSSASDRRPSTPRARRDTGRATKASEILDAAEKLFATRPFHEVLLDDIAATAHVGKGTVYVHYASKEEVYLAVVRRGFDAVLSRLDNELPGLEGKAWTQMQVIVASLVDFAFAHPGVFQLMRSGVVTPEDPGLVRTRARLTERIEGVLRAGVSRGELRDPCPALTTQFVFSCVRGASLYPPKGMSRGSLTAHILHLLQHGIGGGAR